MDYRKMKNVDIIDELVHQHSMNREILSELSRGDIIAKLKHCHIITKADYETQEKTVSIIEDNENDFVEFETAEETIEDLGNPNDVERPQMGDVKWHDYVISLFEEDEIKDGSPTVSGLRRVTEACLGKIVDSGPINVDIRNSDPNDLYVCVTYLVTVVVDNTFDGHVITQREVASVWFQNLGDGKVRGSIEPDFAVYAEANASTRAEGRTLRKLLRLKNTIAYEEKCNDESVTPQHSGNSEFNEEEPIQSNQINFLDSKCRQLDINLIKFINSGEDKYEKIKDVTRGTAQNMAQVINGFQTNLDSIPANLVGYDEDWRKQ